MKSDLVLFHLRNKIDYFPKRAYSNQRFVHVVYESPVHCHLCDQYDDQFNISASYSSDSDYTSLYYTDSGLFWKNPGKENYENIDIYATKNSQTLVAALISHCTSSNGRLDFINELSRFINVKIYGLCGEKCPKNVDCKEWIGKKYKFYLAFENSLCRDYITEKFFYMLRYDIIPIVLGSGNYTRYVPKSAFINAFDFVSPKHLADYLTYLNQNKTAYNEYFKWKKYIGFRKSNEIVKAGFLCEMCIQLHLEEQLNEIKKQTLTNLKQIFGMEENCLGANNQEIAIFKYLKSYSLNHSFYMHPE